MWRKRLLEDSPALITPEEQDRLRSEALAKLEASRILQQQVREMATDMRERNHVNNYAAGLLESYGVMIKNA